MSSFVAAGSIPASARVVTSLDITWKTCNGVTRTTGWLAAEGAAGCAGPGLSAVSHTLSSEAARLPQNKFETELRRLRPEAEPGDLGALVGLVAGIFNSARFATSTRHAASGQWAYATDRGRKRQRHTTCKRT